LQFALDRLAGKVRETFPGTLRLQLDPAALVPSPTAKAFFQIAECAVDNALDRPGCSLIEIQLKRSHGDFVLEVRHNGKAPEAGDTSLDRLRMDYYASKSQVALEVIESESGAVVRASHSMASGDTGQKV
jgi:signal transduction histidine kinase